MKRLFYIILLTFIGMTAFSQSPTKYVNLLPSYPPAIGVAQYDNFVYINSGLYRQDILLDSLPHYEIEQIPDQTVRFLEDGIGFYVKADSLHSSNVVYSYVVDQAPIGPFEFNTTTGRFKFYPDAGDYMPFTVTFTASSGINSLSQTVNFDILAEVMPESVTIQSLGEMPSAQDYTIIAQSHTQMFLNNANRDTVYSYSISGKDIVFDNNVQNKVWGLSGREDMYELNLFAERLYIRSALEFPHTNVNIYARELIFEDNGNEIASINTTPSAIGTLTNDTGMDGENAGNITLNVKTLKADFAKRFILNGAQGQSTNRNGVPGNGGNGGVLTASFNIENYCDFARGSAGIKYDVEGRAGHGPVIGAGQSGMNGHFELSNSKYNWIHPYYFAAVIRHINDSYLNNYFSYSKTTANDYYNLISQFEASDEWDDFDEPLKIELQDQEMELEAILYRLSEGLDYFGNPLGWVPMLSFEVLLNNYNNEIDRAMPTLYLNYWLQHIDQTLASWVTASQFAANQTQSEIIATQDQINSLINDIPVLEDKIEELIGQISEDSIKLEQKKAELMRKARHNVKKRNRINKAFGICKTALNCIPGVGGVIGGVASELVTLMDYVPEYFNIADTYGYENSLSSNLLNLAGVDYGSSLYYLQQTVNSINLDSLGHIGHDLIDNYHNLNNTIKPVYNSIKNIHNTFAKSSTPQNEVEAEFDKLCKQSVEYQQIVAELKALEQSKIEFQEKLKQTFANMENWTSEVSNELVTLDALRKNVFEGNSQRDLQAMQCIEKMRQRAMNRLVKYHYYMRKAYEYRLLRPYQGDYSLEYMYNRLEILIGQAITNQGNSFDNSSPAGFTNYSTLSALFREEVSGVIEDVVDELTYNAPEQTASISFVIPKEVLDKINANEEYNLNMFELGLFSPDEENIRITGFEVQYMEAHTVGNPGMSTYMDIDLVHSGISRFKKNGEVYWFNHISTSTQNAHPNTWRIRYNPLTQQTTAIGPSFAIQSLLYSLLGGNAENIMLFSRPAAWSDIYMSKKVHTSGNADIIIDSLILNLQYDFTPRPTNIRNIDITTSDGLLPYIACSEADRNGRSNGKGSFHRSYTRNNGTITFTAMETHGNYHFVNWTNRLGNVVSENTALTVNKMTDQFYRANYELWIPVINVADTIFVGSGSGEYMVQIQNIGQGDIEMDWYVSDSLSTWVHIDGIAEGIDDGYFTFTYDPMRNRDRRIDSLEILAPEIAGMSKMIYIVQDPSLLGVSVSINPVGAGTVNGAGFFEEGETCTLTAIANDGHSFINWTENGTQISTDTIYTFQVTGNRNLVANFTNPPQPPTGVINGIFSVSDSQQVYFSQGNLQYQASTNTWRFAENQWDYVGDANSNIGSDNSGWIDLFGWGTSGYNHGAVCYQPWSTTPSHFDYYVYGCETCDLNDQTGQADWGYNAISNGGGQVNQWHTLTKDEWNYVFNTRSTSSGIRYAKATINGVNGVILLPDDWNNSIYSLSNTNDEGANYDSNILTVSQWETLEQNGAVFLPAAGRRWNNMMNNLERGGYWSATHKTDHDVYQLRFDNNSLNAVANDARDNGFSVRLVRPVQDVVTQTINLSEGWNWFSTYVDITLDDLKDALVEALPGTAITIKSQTQNTTYNPNTQRWGGNLTWDVAKMYNIKVAASCEITLVGTPINPAEHPVTIVNGVNWIGFPFSENMSISDVFAGFAANGDKVKSQNSTGQYQGGSWRGNLNALEPGKGYVYISNTQGIRIFIFPINTK